MKLRDMFISEEQLAADSLIREVHEELWLRESDGFGEKPSDEDGFVDEEPEASSKEEEDDEGDEEFNGAPADPVAAGSAEGFSDEPIFGKIPEPSADPDSSLWHTHVEFDGETLDNASDHVDVSFPDYEGPKARSAHDDEERDEHGFYPRASKKKSKK
jgi:hypothetical protein